MQESLDIATDPWGIKVTRVELKNIEPPAAIQEAMEKQMKAERERREAIIRAEGEKKSMILVAEGNKESAVLNAEAEKEAAILRAEAEKEKLRANLLRAVSHDLRTPLTSMIGASSSYLENETTLSSPEKRHTRNAGSSAAASWRRMDGLPCSGRKSRGPGTDG